MVKTRAMAEMEMKQFFELMQSIKNGQEEIKAGQRNLGERLEEIKADIVSVLNTKVDIISEKVEKNEVFQISSESGDGNGFFVEAYVNNLPCRMIIDTGANITIMHEDIAQQLNEKIIWMPPYVTLQTVTSDKILIIDKMNIKITFGNNSYLHTVYVAKITDSFILGLDFLKKCNFILDFKDNSLHSRSEDVTLFRKEVSEIKSCYRIIAPLDFIIPARKELILEGYSDKEKNFRLGLLKFPDFENFPKGVLVASTLIDFSKEAIPVRIANISDKPKIIKKGEVLATCTPVTCVKRSSFQTSNGLANKNRIK